MENSNYNQFYQMPDDGVLDWDSVVEEQVYIPIKPGRYPFVVTSYARGRHNASAKLPACPQATVNIIVRAGGEVGDREMSRDFFLHKKTQGFLFEFFRSIGCATPDGKIQMDWNRVQGAQGWVEIYDRPYKTKDGRDATAADIRRFIDPKEMGAAQGYQSQTASPTAMPTAAPATGGWAPGGF